MKIVRDEDGSAPRLRVSGECDLSNAAELRCELQRMLERLPTQLTVDLSDVTYFDSSGLSVLADAARSLGRRLVVIADEPIVQVIRITGLDAACTLEAADRAPSRRGAAG